MFQNKHKEGMLPFFIPAPIKRTNFSRCRQRRIR